MNNPEWEKPSAQFYKLTKLEKFVWQNRERNFDTLASETNRAAHAISSAYIRALRKMNAAANSVNATSRTQTFQTGILL